MAAASSNGCPAASVLVADHDADNRDALGALLSSVGLQVRLVGSVADLLAARPGKGPNCLIMEYRLQGMNGLELYTRLQSAGMDLPVIFVSSHSDIPVAVRAMKAGAVDFLAKPVRAQDLLDAVHVALERDARRRAELVIQTDIENQLESLTPREREVMWHVTSGLMNKQVAGLLGLSEITVKVHRSNVMRKMKARSLADLIAKANALSSARAPREVHLLATGPMPRPSPRFSAPTSAQRPSYA